MLANMRLSLFLEIYIHLDETELGMELPLAAIDANLRENTNSDTSQCHSSAVSQAIQISTV